jgi:hypothetical protein
MTPWKPKIRWYDYVLALVAADFMTDFLFRGFFATTWWEPMLYGLLAGIIWQAWKNDYCKFRLLQEFMTWRRENR